jgi:hypothetical protein
VMEPAGSGDLPAVILAGDTTVAMSHAASRGTSLTLPQARCILLSPPKAVPTRAAYSICTANRNLERFKRL